MQDFKAKSRFGIHTERCEDCSTGNSIDGSTALFLCLGDTRPRAVSFTTVTTIPLFFCRLLKSMLWSYGHGMDFVSTALGLGADTGHIIMAYTLSTIA